MGGQNGWRTNITFKDWMRDIEKRILNEERRPIIRAASDLMGPGAGPYAIETLDWNADETTFNGWFYSRPGALELTRPDAYPGSAPPRASPTATATNWSASTTR